MGMKIYAEKTVVVVRGFFVCVEQQVLLQRRFLRKVWRDPSVPFLVCLVPLERTRGSSVRVHVRDCLLSLLCALDCERDILRGSLWMSHTPRISWSVTQMKEDGESIFLKQIGDSCLQSYACGEHPLCRKAVKPSTVKARVLVKKQSTPN